ncbi:MAG TPA: flagellar basal body protein, partial [Alphaproteobacteria bacterium]|nr:flagellar basal body protein [Alphaproteobacteria bacterium]
MDSPQIAVLSQQQQLKRRMDVVANNLANLSTTGFKRHLAIAGVRGSG